MMQANKSKYKNQSACANKKNTKRARVHVHTRIYVYRIKHTYARRDVKYSRRRLKLMNTLKMMMN